jgi:ubiquinone/menaquinone biosynthesis C-methylase UbiE
VSGADHFQAIYRARAAEYDALVSREDYQGRLLPALAAIRPLAGLDVVEFGAGTGRLTRLLAPEVALIVACDASAHMLAFAARQLAAGGLRNWRLAVADNRRLPLAARRADLALAGWSFGHSCGWHPASWRAEIDLALGEMRRVLQPGGVAVVLETLGTGRSTPAPPSPALAEYYAWLEREHGFAREWIRTDYRFASPEEAEALTRFFFGAELAERVARERLTILPECTGLWWRVWD